MCYRRLIQHISHNIGPIERWVRWRINFMFRARKIDALEANIENFIYEIPTICWREYAKIVYNLWTICDTASVNIMIKSFQINKSYISLIFMDFKLNLKVLNIHRKMSSLFRHSYLGCHSHYDNGTSKNFQAIKNVLTAYVSTPVRWAPVTMITKSRKFVCVYIKYC